MARAEDHIRELLKLPPEERAQAAKILLDSLDEDGDDPEAEALKVAELIRRAQSVLAGRAELVNPDDARRRVMARLREVRGE
jgi:putative addiction module component (TIGR02574 family)